MTFRTLKTWVRRVNLRKRGWDDGNLLKTPPRRVWAGLDGFAAMQKHPALRSIVSLAISKDHLELQFFFFKYMTWLSSTKRLWFELKHIHLSVKILFGEKKNGGGKGRKSIGRYYDRRSNGHTLLRVRILVSEFTIDFHYTTDDISILYTMGRGLLLVLFVFFVLLVFFHKTRCQIWCTIELHRDPILKVLSEC